MVKDLMMSAAARLRRALGAVRTHMPYVALALVFLASGCTSGVAESGAGSTRVEGTAGESAARGGNIEGVIFVVPPDGVPLSMGLILADAIAAEIRDHDYPAILAREPNQAGASVVGALASNEPRGQVNWLTLDWSIRAPYGTLVTTYRQQVVIDARMWDTGAAEAINLLVGDAAPRIVTMVQTYVGPPEMLAMVPSDAPADPPSSPTPIVPMPDGAPASVPENAPGSPLQTTPAPAPMAADAPPAPAVATGAPQPLGRIAIATNGQIVRPEGAAPDAAAVPAELPSLAPASEVAVNTPQMPSPPVAGAAPRPLIPGGAREVAPPPGGVAPEQPQQTEEAGLLDRLMPAMDTDTRRPDDARPGGPGSAGFAPVRWGQPSFMIQPVKGASGNGNEALTAALKTALRERDLTISEDPRQAGFVIQGDVDMGKPVNGRQYVRISWRVDTVTGTEVGKAVQENTIVAGSLDGEWGRVAEIVSHAAVRGIQDLFGDADAHLREREQLPEFPNAELPTVPGRAPPPPSGN